MPTPNRVAVTLTPRMVKLLRKALDDASEEILYSIERGYADDETGARRRVNQYTRLWYYLRRFDPGAPREA
jgi:hypothetical protein